MAEKKKTLSISEVNKDTTLSVVATLDGKKLELPVDYAKVSPQELAEIKEHYGNLVIPLEDVVKQWQEQLFEVSFKGHLSKLELLAINTEGVYHWDNIKIYKVKLTTGLSVNLLKVKLLEGEKFNRRRGVRIALDKSMDIQQNGEILRVIVRDLSYCGLGFIEPGESKVKLGVPFILFLMEDTDDGEKLIGKFTGKVINQRELPAGGIFSGCVLSADHSSFLQRYIAMKQMEQLSGKKMNATIQKNATGDNWKNKIVDSLVESLDE
ncbi:hypothetical protein SAMN05421493_101371 [Pseudobutyrivibrio sp. 49]|uniref:PilZ domain-containing protein n=1 Tax=unclassified Pseudobutyrivibrio TaxID=2638619 RepID=UPI00088F87CB|nr:MULTISPECIES: PilZ domain-containing protein [unclassified Pseudobutyrivibrio]SDH35288.1 hypothetical protein SAMN05421493_101371 [Pseudobutyrivibrio sp. 49]SFN48014.1 hypothetical protein SAMN04487831_101360 [Pseudobutyrivibrio sp. UC1225]